MTKRKPMTVDEISSLVDAEIRDAVNYCGPLSAARKKNLNYFLGLAIGDLAPPEIDGRSSVVDPVVRNTVLGMEAPLIKTFCGTDNVVEFSATTEDDEDKAKQATDYLNHILRKKNPGYSIISTWIRDALVQKVGYIAVWWDDSKIESTEEYRGQTAEQLAILFDDGEVEPTAQKSYPDPDEAKQKAKQLEQMREQFNVLPAQAAKGLIDPQVVMQAARQLEAFENQPATMLYDVSVKRVKKGGRLCIENIPPEEMLVSRRCKSLDDKTFKGRRLRRTINQLRASGYKNVDSISSDDSADLNDEARARNYLGDNMPTNGIEIDPGQREVWITECYVHADFDGTGIAEWHKIVRAGDQLLEDEPCDEHPFVDLCPIPLPHQHVGMCPADLGVEPQRVSTALLRAQLDNVYLQVNGRYFAVNGQVNLDDLLTSRPGGVVRISTPGAVGRLDQAVGDSAQAMALMELYQNMTEESTGWTRQSSGGNGMGLDATATQANIVTNRADSRIEIISRQFAETGFTRLFKKMLRLVTQYQDKAEQVKLGNKWQNIDPREWTNQFDLTINVGLGTGNKDQQIQHLMMLKQEQLTAIQIGIATPANLYNANVKLAEALGFKNGNQFFTDPEAPPDPNAAPKPPPPPDPEVVKAQAAQQAQMAELQFKQQSADADRQHSAQLEQFKGDLQMQTDRNRQEVEAQQKQLELEQVAQIEALKEQYRNEEAREKLQLDIAKMELERYKIDKDAETKIVLAQIAAKQAGDAALIAAEATANQGAANGDD
jgi:hypothetical protein